ncbi:hypothetical protein F5Y19DRAFT_456351 [Xylariaceae sp. FL1651]|nr:hypothetical protein F5Y19DRAFT_456351 [Xylariaceae sp. FL1651]
MSNKIQEPSGAPGQVQPWKKWWPPKDVDQMTQSELAAKPWINWKPNPSEPNSKPWLQWVPRDAHLYKNLNEATIHMNQSHQAPNLVPKRYDSKVPPPSSNAEGG